MTKLFTHNVDVDKVNEDELSRIDAPTELFIAECFGYKKVIETIKKSVLAPEELTLKT